MATGGRKMQWKRRLAIGVLSLGILVGCATTGEQMATKEKSLYDRLGQKLAIEAVVDDFVTRVGRDDRINKFFQKTDAVSFKAKLVDQICEASGGPCKYTGIYKDMKTAHKGMGITDADFNALVEDLAITLDKFIQMKTITEKEKKDLLAALGPMKADIVMQ
jgi:hemoglobin